MITWPFSQLEASHLNEAPNMGTWLIISYAEANRKKHKFFFLILDAEARYAEAQPLLLEAIKGHHLKLSDNHPHTRQSLNNLIELYEAWNKPEEAKE